MHSWMQILSGGSMDGSIAYQQFRQSDNPYSPIFLKNLAGTATVGPLELVDKAQAKPQSKQAIPGQSPAPSDQDSQHDPGL
jgi:hypothetical protein